MKDLKTQPVTSLKKEKNQKIVGKTKLKLTTEKKKKVLKGIKGNKVKQNHIIFFWIPLNYMKYL